MSTDSAPSTSASTSACALVSSRALASSARVITPAQITNCESITGRTCCLASSNVGAHAGQSGWSSLSPKGACAWPAVWPGHQVEGRVRAAGARHTQTPLSSAGAAFYGPAPPKGPQPQRQLAAPALNFIFVHWVYIACSSIFTPKAHTSSHRYCRLDLIDRWPPLPLRSVAAAGL